jgi:protein CpxP
MGKKVTQFITALAVVSAASVFGLNAWANGGEGAASGASAMMHGHRSMMGEHGGGMGLMPMGGRHLDRMLDEVKATDAQRTQIKALAKSAEADLKPLHEQARSLHEQSLALFAQPKIDAAAAEKLRQQMLASHDAMSKRVLQAALDVSKVLTPEQRATLVAKLQKHRGHMNPHGQEHAQLEQ